MTPSPELKPLSLRRDGNGLRIQWNDGQSTFLTWTKLRKSCPCATCVDIRAKPADPFKLLSTQEIAAGEAAPVSMQAKGHYAYQIAWNDGHDTGIYSLQLLRQLSESDPE